MPAFITFTTFVNVYLLTCFATIVQVELTWDNTDPHRTLITTKAFSTDDWKLSDFKAYLASSSESEADEDDWEEIDFGTLTHTHTHYTHTGKHTKTQTHTHLQEQHDNVSRGVLFRGLLADH